MAGSGKETPKGARKTRSSKGVGLRSPKRQSTRKAQVSRGGATYYRGKQSAFSLRRLLFSGGFLRFMMTAGITSLLFLLVFFIYAMKDLPDISTLTEPKKVPSIVLRTTEGDIIGSSGHIYGEYMRYEDIPRSLILALVATEDRNFFRHHGVDPWGLIRAMAANIRAGRWVQGGSTLTQQLAKNIFLTPEKSLKRKLQEFIIALSLERRYSKQEIITVYLNRVYFGAGTYGIDAASWRYFDKSARKLLLPEAAMLVGLLKAPSRYAPTSNRDLAIGRANQVLLNMVDAGLLEAKQQKAASSMYRGLSFPDYVSSSGQRYYIDWILDQIPSYVGNVERDLIVTTAFNPDLQEKAEKAIDQVLTNDVANKRKVGQVAFVTMSPDGGVLALVGGRDYSKSQYNRVTQARRQPGSAFKLFVYLAALEAGYRPVQMVEDAPITIGKWSPSNYNRRYEGLMPMRQAVAHSINTVAVRLSEEVGRGKVIEMARRLGLNGKIDNVPSIALGVTTATLLEMTSAYGTLANNGNAVRPYGILSIKDAYGKVIYQHRSPQQMKVLGGDTVKRMNDMLIEVVESGTGRAARIGRPAAGKTGTTQNYQDAAFYGYTPQLVTGVWVGNDNNSPTNKITGGNLPAQIWARFMKDALADIAPRELPRDDGSARWWEFGSSDQPRAATTANAPKDQRENFWDNLFSGEGSAPAQPERDGIRR